MTLQPTWKTYNTADLAISLVLLSLFLNQNLQKQDKILWNDDKKEELEYEASKYLIYTLVMLIPFVVIVVLHCVVYDFSIDKFTTQLHIFEFFTYIFSFVVIHNAIKTQQHFKLKMDLL